ncbi:MAG: fumarylacetoacetate hydrolase family protein [Myxococcota bacterium]
MPRYVYFTMLGKHRWGRVVDDGLQPLEGSLFEPGLGDAGAVLPWHLVRFDPPVRPSKIVCIGKNYRAHADEMGGQVPEQPLIFLKAPSALIGHEGRIVYPTGQTDLVHHEGELAVVIGRRTRRVSPEEAPRHVLGYTILNDVTARDLQRKDVQFARAKGFDTFAPMGPWLDTDFEPGEQRLTTTVNGEVRQDAPLSDMVFPPHALVSYVSRGMTLEPGDVIATGTPSGVGPLVPGDTVEVTLEGLGTLRNTVVADEESVWR